MFNRFTDRARKVMGNALHEAERLNHDHIGTEHILLGLVKEGCGVAASVLGNLGIDLKKLRDETQKRIGKGSAEGGGQLPFTQHAKNVLDCAIQEAKQLKHKYVGTEHVLLGLLDEDESRGAEVLTALGVKLDDVRREVMEILGADTEAGPGPERTGPGMPWSQRAARAVEYAEEEARGDGSARIEIEHLRRGAERAERE